jgi:hypothetical protein
VKKLLLLCVLTLGCSDDSSGDGGPDSTAEAAPDLCDIDLFTGNGNACPHASTRVCFGDPTCEAGNGCTCENQAGSPTWSCFTPPECLFPCTSSPFVDAAPCDGGDETSAGDDAGDDSSTTDAAADAADAGTD